MAKIHYIKREEIFKIALKWISSNLIKKLIIFYAIVGGGLLIQSRETLTLNKLH